MSVKKIEVPLLLALGVFAWKSFVFTQLLMALLLLANDVVSMAGTGDAVRPSPRPDTWSARKIVLAAVAVAAPMLAASAAVLAGAVLLGALAADAVKVRVFRHLGLHTAARPQSV